jgi:hypothetical protein
VQSAGTITPEALHKAAKASDSTAVHLYLTLQICFGGCILKYSMLYQSSGIHSGVEELV